MALDQKFFKKSTATAATGLADQTEGLVLHLDANDVDSYDGDGSVWYDIAKHDVNIPLISDDTNLKIHYDPSNTNSYSGTGTTLTNLAGNSLNATVVASRFDNDFDSGLKGYFDISTQSEATISIPSGHPLNGDFTLEFWFRWQGTPGSGGHRFINESTDNLGFFYYKNYGWRFYEAGTAHSGYYGGGGGSIQANVWQHKVITFSGTAFKGYLDGNQIHSTTYTRPGSSLGSFNFGTTNITADKPDCDIGAIRMYDRALTAAEVGQNFRAGNNFSYSSIITSKHEATQGSLITVPPTQSTLYTSNLAFHLDANGHSGTYWTDSANNINGTINGATYVDNDNSDYFTFDGSNDTVTFPASDTSPINFSSETHAIEFWVNFNNLANDDVILGKFGGSNTLKSFQIQVSSTNKLTVLERDGGSNNTFETTGTFSNGTWAHFTYVRSASQVILYINGALDSTHSASNAINAGSTQDITIGNQAGASVYFDGKLAQLRIYSSTLDSSQITTNYNATKDLYQGGTNIELHLDANGYSTGAWTDSSGNSRNGTITAAAHTNDNNSDYFTFTGATGSSGDKVVVAHSTDLDADQDFSVELWAWRNDDTDHSLISKGTGGASWDISFGASSGFGYQFNNYSGSATVRTGTGDFTSANRWEHIVVTYDTVTKKPDFFIDGVLRVGHTHTAGSSPSGNSGDLIIGGYYSYPARHGWNGRIAQVRFYKGKLTQAQVTANYNATKALYQNPIALIDYRPDQYSGSGTSITNSGSLSNDAVLTGGIESTYDKELGDFFTIDGGSNTGDGIETTSNVTGVNLNTDGFSWEIWVNITSDSYSYITSFNYSSTYYNFSYRSDSNKVMFFNLGTALTTPALDLNRWYHIVGTANSAGTKLYTDGVLSASNTTAAPNHNLDSKIYFGTYWGHNSAQHIHTGPIGDGRFYKGVLTAEQVAQNYLATKNKYTNGNNATITGASWNTNSSPAYNYFTFDGSNDKMEIAHSSDVQIDGPYTWMFWFRPHNTNSGKYLMSKIQNSPYGQNILLQSSNVIRFTGYSSGGNGSRHETATSAFTDNAWQHLAITIEGNSSGDDIDFFINGSQVGHSTGTYSSATLIQDQASDTSNANLFLGAYQFGSSPNHFFDGDIGYYKCFKKQLSSAEILTEYNATKGTYGL